MTNSPTAAVISENGIIKRHMKRSLIASEKRRKFAGSLSNLYLMRYVMIMKRFHSVPMQNMTASNKAMGILPCSVSSLNDQNSLSVTLTELISGNAQLKLTISPDPLKSYPSMMTCYNDSYDSIPVT
jgi:hypothetical protein